LNSRILSKKYVADHLVNVFLIEDEVLIDHENHCQLKCE